MQVVPTEITSLDRVDFVGSPKHILSTNDTETHNSVLIKLWIWSGDLLTPYTDNSQPTITGSIGKVSASDNYISIEVSEYIKPYINPKLIFNFGSTTTTGEGVYYQYELHQYNGSTLVSVVKPSTRFATLGYNYNYEGEKPFNYNRGSFGYYDTDIQKYYSPYLRYFDANINLTGVTNTESMIIRTPAVYESANERCSSDPMLIIYLNKLGLWDTFTPTGKITISNSFKREKYNRGFRNPSSVNQNIEHQSTQYNINNIQSFIVNTGSITEQMGQLVEEILDSSKIYLVSFKPIGSTLTVDNTYITIDNTLITVDREYLETIYPGTESYIYRQIPVIVTDNDFLRKTRLNDRALINYNIKFEEASSKINNLR